MWKLLLLVLYFFPSTECQFFIEQKKTFDDLQILFVDSEDSTVFKAFYYNETEKLLKDPNYNNGRPTVLYCYGYTEHFMRQSTQTVVKAYIKRGGYNVLVLEWSKYSAQNYIFEAIPNARIVGDETGKLLWKMRGLGFNLNNFHLVGHSLGGQLVGFIGRGVYKYSSNTYKMPIIMSLDPAGPFFYGFNGFFSKPINCEDAHAVHIIHTDSNFFGTNVKCGTADFWPNSGKEQPACPPANYDIYNEDNFCSHRRSWAYFAESVETKEPSFYAVKCSSWSDFISKNCLENDTQNAFMGIDSKANLIGDFYLQTNAQPPYGRGLKGVYFDETL